MRGASPCGRKVQRPERGDSLRTVNRAGRPQVCAPPPGGSIAILPWKAWLGVTDTRADFFSFFFSHIHFLQPHLADADAQTDGARSASRGKPSSWSCFPPSHRGCKTLRLSARSDRISENVFWPPGWDRAANVGCGT